MWCGGSEVHSATSWLCVFGERDFSLRFSFLICKMGIAIIVNSSNGGGAK